MNWKNVLNLMQVERKSGRLIRGQKLTRYRENRFLAYWPYWLALGLGIATGVLAGYIYNLVATADAELLSLFQEGTLSICVSLPTLVLVYSLVFTTMQQIRVSGVKTSSQVPFWLPVTWQEHTMASILASLMGFPLASVVFIASAITVFAAFVGQIPLAVFTSLAVFAAAFMASAMTEVFRILQVRFIGAVYKSTGRAAVWVRFAGSLLFFLVFYIIYFYVVYGSGAIDFIQTVASVQSTVWFVPFVWLGLALFYSFISGELFIGIALLAFSLLFIAGLFFLATWLNTRFGLYEPPAITVSRGAYTPKTGFLGKLGFSTVEAAIFRKDLRAFTRRRELMTIFIFPIIVILVPLMQYLGQSEAVPTPLVTFYRAIIFLVPAAVMSMGLGNFMIGEEGQTVWRVYASPISAKSLVKSKYLFIVFFSLIVLLVTGVFGFIIYNPTLPYTIVACLEAVFLVFALGAISLANGIIGADFTETPRPRMIRVSWSIINLVACLAAAAFILAPFVPSALSSILSGVIPDLFGGAIFDQVLSVVVSAVIAVVVVVISYQIALRNAKELLRKAEI